jgi:hypothetical protein
MKLPIDESKISELDKQNPTVLLLLEVIRQQAETIEQLRDEINRLKNHPRKPDIKPSRLEKDKSQSQSKKDRGERPGSKKRKKTAEITIHEDIPVEPPYLPKGARFIAYKNFVVQGIKFQACNVGYRLKYYELPDGSHTCAKLPEHLNGKHFSPELISFILYQHYHFGRTISSIRMPSATWQQTIFPLICKKTLPATWGQPLQTTINGIGF